MKTVAEILGSFDKAVMSVNMLTEDRDLMSLISPKDNKVVKSQTSTG